jgi:hypothetical protein
MSLGGILLLALVVAVVVIGMKVRKNTLRLQEIDELLEKGVEEDERRAR